MTHFICSMGMIFLYCLNALWYGCITNTHSPSLVSPLPSTHHFKHAFAQCFDFTGLAAIYIVPDSNIINMQMGMCICPSGLVPPTSKSGQLLQCSTLIVNHLTPVNHLPPIILFNKLTRLSSP